MIEKDSASPWPREETLILISAYQRYSMLTAEGIIGALADHRARIRSLGVRRIGIFGSFVRGEEGEDSDIDILIEFEEGRRSFDTYMDLTFFLEDLFGRSVDLVDRDTLKPGLAPHILRSVRYVQGI